MSRYTQGLSHAFTRYLVSNLVCRTSSSVSRTLRMSAAASFVQSVVSSFERHYDMASKSDETDDAPQSDSGLPGKECSNWTILLSDLYNLGVFSCTLMYDIIRKILDGRLSELDVELLLKLTRGILFVPLSQMISFTSSFRFRISATSGRPLCAERNNPNSAR